MTEIDPNLKGENQGTGAEILEQMPEFREHMRSFSEVKESREVPEGVRDEQDYKEYLAEQEARAKEYEKFDNEIFEGIMSIEDPNDHDLATAILPFYYNDQVDEDDTYKEARRAGMKAVVNYMHSDKTTSLENAVRKVANDLYHNPKYTDGEDIRAGNAAFNPILNLHSRESGQMSNRLDELRDGQKIERLDLPEAEFDEEDEEYRFKYDEGNGLERTEYFSVDRGTSLENTKIVLTIANDITKQIKDTSDYEKNYNNLCKIQHLQQAFWAGGPRRVEEKLHNERERQITEVVNSAKKVMDTDDYDRRNSSLSIGGNLIQVVCLEELINTFKKYKDANREYNNSLEVGKSILGGGGLA